MNWKNSRLNMFQGTTVVRLHMIRIMQINHSVNSWASSYMSQYSLKLSLAERKFKFHACLFTGAKFSFIYRVSQKKRGAFEGLWHRIEPLDYQKQNFSVLPRV